MARYIAITDIHGELAKLENLLSKLELSKDDTFIFMLTGFCLKRFSKNYRGKFCVAKFSMPTALRLAMARGIDWKTLQPELSEKILRIAISLVS